MAKDTILEAEVIYGALRREKIWQMAFGGALAAAVISIGAAGAVLVSMRPPAPVVVPFDPTTGMAVPNAAVGAVTLNERDAVIQSLIYQYVVDRETYNQIDNDLRITRAIERSSDAARSSLIAQWDSTNEDNLPDLYGRNTVVNVVVTGITILDADRVQVRLRKDLTSPDGDTSGNFTAIAGIIFEPGEERTLEAVWKNPLGFKVNEYRIFSDRAG